MVKSRSVRFLKSQISQTCEKTALTDFDEMTNIELREILTDAEVNEIPDYIKLRRFYFKLLTLVGCGILIITFIILGCFALHSDKSLSLLQSLNPFKHVDGEVNVVLISDVGSENVVITTGPSRNLYRVKRTIYGRDNGVLSYGHPQIQQDLSEELGRVNVDQVLNEADHTETNNLPSQKGDTILSNFDINKITGNSRNDNNHNSFQESAEPDSVPYNHLEDPGGRLEEAMQKSSDSGDIFRENQIDGISPSAYYINANPSLGTDKTVVTLESSNAPHAGQQYDEDYKNSENLQESNKNVHNQFKQIEIEDHLTMQPTSEASSIPSLDKTAVGFFISTPAFSNDNDVAHFTAYVQDNHLNLITVEDPSARKSDDSGIVSENLNRNFKQIEIEHNHSTSSGVVNSGKKEEHTSHYVGKAGEMPYGFDNGKLFNPTVINSNQPDWSQNTDESYIDNSNFDTSDSPHVPNNYLHKPAARLPNGNTHVENRFLKETYGSSQVATFSGSIPSDITMLSSGDEDDNAETGLKSQSRADKNHFELGMVDELVEVNTAATNNFQNHNNMTETQTNPQGTQTDSNHMNIYTSSQSGSEDIFSSDTTNTVSNASTISTAPIKIEGRTNNFITVTNNTEVSKGRTVVVNDNQNPTLSSSLFQFPEGEKSVTPKSLGDMNKTNRILQCNSSNCVSSSMKDIEDGVTVTASENMQVASSVTATTKITEYTTGYNEEPRPYRSIIDTKDLIRGSGIASNLGNWFSVCGNYMNSVENPLNILGPYYNKDKLHKCLISFKKAFEAPTEPTLQQPLENLFQRNNTRAAADCPIEQISCRNDAKCINAEQFCDGRVHCRDASDEESCPCIRKISKVRLCDGYWDCPNGDDEKNCFGCSSDSFNCDDWSQPEQLATCIPLEQRCDGIEQCPTGKDELDCSMLLDTINAERFAVSKAVGFLYHNYKSQWYKPCGMTDLWAMEACASEIGPTTRAPVTHQVQIGNQITGPFLYVTPVDPPRVMNSCPNGETAFVECPPMMCGTRMKLRNPYRSEEVDVSAERVMAQFQSQIGMDAIVGEGRVVGGKPSQPDSWPWITAVYRNGAFHCGGVIINERWIITAAHCVDRYWQYYFEVQTGIIRRYSYSPMQQTRTVSHIITYQLYDRAKLKNDLALMEVAESFNFNRYVRPICLPSEQTAGFNFTNNPPPGTTCTAVGWGATIEHGSDPDNLREVDVPILGRCRHRADEEGNAICAGLMDGGKDACQGDSGGPLICKNPNLPIQWYLAGIVSHGEGCARPNEPGVYTRVSLFLEWIFTTTSSKMMPQRKPLRRCPGYVCKTTHHCISSKKRCDKIVDCLHADDEIQCERHTFGFMLRDTFRHMLLGSPAESNVTAAANATTLLMTTTTSGMITTLAKNDSMPVTNPSTDTPLRTTTETLRTLQPQSVSTELPDETTTVKPFANTKTVPSKTTSADQKTTFKPSRTTFKLTISATSNTTSKSPPKTTPTTDAPLIHKIINATFNFKGPDVVVPHSTIDPSQHFQCEKMLEFIDVDKVCNGVADCQDATDESYCSCESFLKHTHPEVIGDGISDCWDNSDEVHVVCNYFQYNCHRSRVCIPSNKVCDFVKDCPLSEDEEDCFALSDGKSVNLDENNRPFLRNNGILSFFNQNQWRPFCSKVEDINEAHYASLICSYLGFDEYKSFNRIKINNTFIEPYGGVKSNGSDTIESCDGLYLKCMDVVDMTMDIRLLLNSTSVDQTPWNADIYSNGEYQCSGVLLDLKWVITTSNCTAANRLGYEYISIILGNYRSYLEIPSEIQKIIEIVESLQVFQTDMVLLRLKTPAPFSRYIRPLYFNVKEFNLENETCIAMGRYLKVSEMLLLRSIGNCESGSRCFERLVPAACKVGEPWSGVIVCQSRNGFYPAAVYHEPLGYCGFSGVVKYTSVQYWKTNIQRMMQQIPQWVTSPVCDGVRCTNGKCVPPSERCDGVYNCPDGADENSHLCSKVLRECIPKNNCHCSKSQLRCANGNCIDKASFCNTINDCGDWSDEPDMCTCKSYLALTQPEKICDGVRNCFDKTDEDPRFCNCTGNHYQCKRSSWCIPQEYVCDNFKDCPYGDDESLCFSLVSSINSPKEVFVQTAGIWHPGCFSSNMTVLQLEEICTIMGYDTGSAKKLVGPNTIGTKPVIDRFFGLGISHAQDKRVVITMRSGDKPFVSFKPNPSCSRLYLECLH